MSENVYKVGEVWEDKDGDQWEVRMNGDFHCVLLGLTKAARTVEQRYGPLTRVSTPRPEILKDHDGDTWEALPDGMLYCQKHDLLRDRAYVAREFGPLERFEPDEPEPERAPGVLNFRPGLEYTDRNGRQWRAFTSISGTVKLANAFKGSFSTAYVSAAYGPLREATAADTLRWLTERIEERGSASAEEAPAAPFRDQINDPVEYKLSVDPELVDRIAASYTTDYLGAAAKAYGEALDLLIRKSADYGPLNIAQSPGGPLNGLRVRMWDKTARLNNLIDTGAGPQNESLRDTFVDLLNYSAIALLVLDGNWPGADALAEGDK